jgi:hypothetical protein
MDNVYNAIQIDSYKVLSDNFVRDHMEVHCFDGKFLLLSTLRMCDKRICTAVIGHRTG